MADHPRYVCVIREFEEERWRANGIEPVCKDHHHEKWHVAVTWCNGFAADSPYFGPIATPAGRTHDDRHCIRMKYALIWKNVRGVMQLVRGVEAGHKGKFKYPIPACGAHERKMCVATVNQDDRKRGTTMQPAVENHPAIEPLLDLEEAGRLLGRSHWSLRHDIKRGTLRAVKIGNKWMVEPAELRRVVEEGRRPRAAAQ